MYDIVTPMLFQIENGDNNPKEDFLFNVPIEVNIRNNNPTQELVNSQIISLNIEKENTFTAAYCNENHYLSKDVHISVSELNKFDEKIPLEDVEFNFICSTNVEVVCGITPRSQSVEYNSQKYTLKLPINCPNSQLSILKDGYIEENIIISPKSNSEISESVTLIQPKIIPFNYYIDGRDRINENQNTVIFFEPKNNPEYIQSFSFSGRNKFENLNITLVPDIYKITSFTFDNSSITIPSQPGNTCKWYQRIAGCVDTPDLPALAVDGWVLSNFELDSYVITQDTLKNSNRLIAQIPGINFPKSYDDFQTQKMPVSHEKYIQLR